jgi:hypothetical protein
MTLYALLAVMLLPLVLLIAAAAGWPRRRRPQPFEVSARPVLHKDARTLYTRLHKALPQYVILSRVRLSDFLEPKAEGKRGLAAAQLELDRQTVDFLVCTEELRVVAAVELDDVLQIRPPEACCGKLLRRASIPVLRWNTINLPTQRDIQEAVAELEALRLIHSVQQESQLKAAQAREGVTVVRMFGRRGS